MAHDEPRHPGDEHPGARTDESRHDHGRDSAGPITITTTDPVIDSVVEHQADWKAHPDTTLRVETTQVGEPSPLYVSGVRTVVVEDEPRHRGRRSDDDQDKKRGGRDRGRGDEDRGQDQGQGQGKGQGRRDRDQDKGRDQDKDKDKDKDRDRDGDRDDRPDRSRGPARSQPSMMKNLMITAGVALVCGVIGAMGYSYFFGSKSGDSSDESQGKNQSGQQKQASSKKKSGGGGDSSKGSGKESNAQASNSSSIPGFSSAEDADTLKKQIMDLMHRVDRMGERLDRMTRPKDETPPVLRTMQIKMGELAREMDEVAALPARVRHYDNRLETLQEELKTLRARIEAARGGTIGGRMGPAVTLPPGAVATAPLGEVGPSSNSPTMALGIGLLERGQYATAREVFLRLQVAQPDDARVWYLSALAEGLTGGDWDGAARRLAEKGLECERAGHPSTAQIDAALATRPPIKGEDWIASLRRNVIGESHASVQPPK